jgi:hypothetical protein
MKCSFSVFLYEFDYSVPQILLGVLLARLTSILNLTSLQDLAYEIRPLDMTKDILN